ncbi:NAD(P)H-hydrate epimerase [Oenococcus sicerae]|uniref:NAD(P)H-hydrate epimerase n=2 Tax=Oenococcus sicerae TaxID=2203724 RepID=A0ABX5QPB3_9LACO|nr:NAD(P)H-hydrate epimerase [Oenococcus sicerae]QAS70622.1 NAD(P)H-hydrate epimerase [Oenococcus sicerae]
MTYISAEQSRLFDDFAINKMGISSVVLMERAALAVYRRLLESPNFSLKKVLVIAGTGNNGGDGAAVARLLHLRGISATIWLLGDRQKASIEMQRQLTIAENYGLSVVSSVDDLKNYSTIVDAIFGVGLSRDIKGKFAQVVEQINQSAIPVMAVDIPTGIHADNGQVMAIAVKATETVTMSYNKLGLAEKTGQAFAGLVTISDIGVYDPNSLKRYLD